jgi:hypothetical protein
MEAHKLSSRQEFKSQLSVGKVMLTNLLAYTDIVSVDFQAAEQKPLTVGTVSDTLPDRLKPAIR